MLTPPSMTVRPWFRGMLWGVLAWGWITIGVWISSFVGEDLSALWFFIGAGGAIWNMIAAFVESERKNKW